MSLNTTSPSEISSPWLVDEFSTHLPFEFEKLVDFNKARLWSQENGVVVFSLATVYFLFAQIGPSVMKYRKPFNLQKPLVLWNFLLAAFSIMGVTRMLPTVVDQLMQPNGFYGLACVRKGLSQPAAFWSVAFAFSKFFELADTVFIVARKRPLIFLHWFHHLTIFVGSFVILIEAEPVNSFAVIFNYAVHSVMYTYYTIMALRIKLPKPIAMIVTSIQILQFVCALGIHGYTIVVLAKGGVCCRSPLSIKICFAIGFSYLFLFMKLFYNSYIVNKSKTKTS